MCVHLSTRSGIVHHILFQNSIIYISARQNKAKDRRLFHLLAFPCAFASVSANLFYVFIDSFPPPNAYACLQFFFSFGSSLSYRQ
jgi:hypothetical protein